MDTTYIGSFGEVAMRLFLIISLVLLAGCASNSKDNDKCYQRAQICGTETPESNNTDRMQQVRLWSDDASITAAVKFNFSTDPYIKTVNVHVETKDGAVLLTGFVDRAEVANRAAKLASTVKGVKSVNNQLKVIWGS